MRHRRPDSLSEASVTVKRVRIGRSIWCCTLPLNRGGAWVARRGAPAVLLTAFALQIIHRIRRDEVSVHKVLNDAGRLCRRLGYAYAPVLVCALASSHANTSVRL